MKIKIELDVPEFQWVTVPTEYSTPIGEVEMAEDAERVKDLVEYLQRLNIQPIIESDHQHVRMRFCRDVIRDRLSFVAPAELGYYAEKLSYFLQGFQKRTGRNFSDYVCECRALSAGQKVRIGKLSKLFDSEQEAVDYMIKLQVSTDKFSCVGKATDHAVQQHEMIPAMVCCEQCRRSAIEADPELMFSMTMICCPTCGNKRCPKAKNHLYQCSSSNELGQKGVIVK